MSKVGSKMGRIDVFINFRDGDTNYAKQCLCHERVSARCFTPSELPSWEARDISFGIVLLRIGVQGRLSMMFVTCLGLEAWNTQSPCLGRREYCFSPTPGRSSTSKSRDVDNSSPTGPTTCQARGRAQSKMDDTKSCETSPFGFLRGGFARSSQPALVTDLPDLLRICINPCARW